MLEVYSNDQSLKGKKEIAIMIRQKRGCTWIIQLASIHDALKNKWKSVQCNECISFRSIYTRLHGFLFSTDSHVSKMRISFSLCAQDAGLKTVKWYEEKEQLTQNLPTCEGWNQVMIGGESWTVICMQAACNKKYTIFSNGINLLMKIRRKCVARWTCPLS